MVSVKEIFPKDVENHKMEIALDQGLHRHLRFRDPKKFGMWFDIVTWPGNLCVRGDMGTFVFCRIQDMFEFFRTKREPNLGYWAEKIEATERHGGHLKFSFDKFKENILEQMQNHIEYNEEAWPEKRKESLMEEIEEEIFSYESDSEETLYRQAMDFKFEDKRLFGDFYEIDCREYTVRYEWCCHAIVWGIKMYDEAKQGAANEAISV
jgi:hypothetical protein